MSPVGPAGDGHGACGGHTGVPAEVRALVLQLLERIAPVLDRVREEPPTAATGTCASCPLCALLAALRGERPELAVRLADQAAGLLAVLRTALEEGAPTASGPAPDAAPDSAPAPEPTPNRCERRVQRIHVERVPVAR